MVTKSTRGITKDQTTTHLSTDQGKGIQEFPFEKGVEDVLYLIPESASHQTNEHL